MAAWYDEESELNPAVPSSTAPALPAPGSNPLIQAYQRGLSGEGLPDIQSLLPNYSGSQSVANGLSQYGPAMTPEEYSAYQQQFAPQEAPQEKPFFDLSNTGSALWDAAKSLGTTLPSAYYQFQEGLKRPDEYSPEAKSAFAAQKELEKQNEAITQAQVAANDTDSVSESIREAIPSLGFSGISMGAAIPAGLAGGALTQAAMPMLPGAGVIGGIASSMGASGAASYRMMGNQVLNDVFSAAEAKSQQENKRGLSEEEKAKLYADMRPVAEDSALWEAGPEAVGNALTMVGGGIALKYLGKEALSKIAGGAFKKAGIRAGAAAAAVGGELATETTTQYNQGNNQAKIDAYLSGKPMDEAIQAYQGLEGVGKAFKEVAPPTLALLGMFGLVGGAVKTGSKIHERFVQNPRDAETLVRLAENPEVLTAMPEQSLQNLSVLGGWLQGKTKNPGLEVALGNINQEIDSRNSETEEVQQERQKVLGKLWESMQPQQKAGILSFLGNDAPGLTGWTDKDGMATGDIDLAGLDRMQSILGVAGAGMNFRKDGITARDQQKNQEIADAQQAEARLNTKVAGLPSFNELNSMNPVEFDQFRQTLSQKPDVLDQLNPQEQQDWLNLFDQKIESFTSELEATRKYASTVGADPAVLAQEVNARRVADPQNPRPYLDTLNDTVVEKQRSLLSGEIAAIQQQMDSGQPVDTGRLIQRRVILEQQLQGLQGEIDKPATPLESLSVTPRPVGQPSAPSSAVPATPIDLPTIRSQAIQAYQQSAEAQALDGQIAAHQGLLNGLPPVPQMRAPIEQKITQLTEQKAQYEQAAVAKAVEAAQAKNAQALSGLGFNESTAPQSVVPGVPAPEVPSANSGWLGGSLPTSDETTNNLSTNPASALPGINVPNPVSTPAPLAIPESARPAPKSVPVSNPLTGQVIDIDTSGDSAALNLLRQMAAQVAASQPAPAVVQPQSVTPRIAPRLMSSQEMREAMNSPTPIQPWEVSLPVWNKVLGAIGQPAITQEAHDTLVQYAKTAGLIAAKPKAKAAETVTETGKKEKGKKGKKDKEAKVETPVPVVPPVVSTNPVPTPVVTPTPTPTSSNPPSSKPAAASSKPPTTGAVNKQRVNTINPKKDSIRRATALAGGWNRIDAEKTHGIDPAEFTTTEGNAPALGAMVFPAQGGLTAEQLSEILGPLGYDVHSNDNTGDTKADGQAFALAFSNPDRQYTADAKIIQDESAREAAERERVLQHNDSDYQTVTATGQDDKGNPINWVWEVRPVKDKLGYFSLHSSRRGVRSKTNEQGRMVPEGKMMVVVTETNGLDVIGKAIRQQAGNIDIKADDLIAPDILNSIPPYEEPAAKPELSPEARDAMMNAVDGDIEKGNPIEVELLEILGIDIPDGWRVENIPASDGKSYATAIPPDKAFENGKWVDREVVDEENTDINLDAKGNSEPLVADDEVIPEPAPAEDEVTELDDDVGTKAAEQKSETKDSNTQASRSPTKSPGISRADFLPAIRKRFPHISNAIEKMLARGEKGQQGGLVLVESADLNEIARVFAEKTGRNFEDARNEIQASIQPASLKSSKKKSEKATKEDLFPDEFANKKSFFTDEIIVSTRGDTEKVRKVNVNSEGKIISLTKQGLRNFYNWFGFSEAVDEKNKPLVLYHSTNADISVFEVNRETSNDLGILGEQKTTRSGIFVTPDKVFSQEYFRDKKGQNIIPVYASMQAAIDFRGGAFDHLLDRFGVREYWQLFDNNADGSNKFIEYMAEHEFDGAIFNESSSDNEDGVATTYAVLDSSQLKSALGNRGTYSIKEKDITFSKDGEINGFYDPKTGLTFAILPNLSPETAGPVILHEGLHAQPSKEMINQAVDMVNNREAVKRPEMREFLNIVNARIEAAKAKDDPREYPNYIVEVAAQMGRQNGFNYADGKFLDWVDAKLSKSVGDIIRKFVNAIRAMMFKVGYPMKWSALTVDDLMNFAVDSLERAAKGDVQVSADKAISKAQSETVRSIAQLVTNGEPTAAELAEAQRQYDAVVERYQGTKEWMKAPNGEPTKLTERQWIQVRTDNFFKYYGRWDGWNDYRKEYFPPRIIKERTKKMLLDKNGEPQILYHGTVSDIVSFDPELSGSKSNTGAPKGSFFLSTDPENAASYAGQRTDMFGEKKYKDDGNVVPAFVSLSNPLVVNAKGDGWRDFIYRGEEVDINYLTEYAQKKGYDGLVVKNIFDTSEGSGIKATTVVAFKPSQIKSSISNVGTFKDTGNIRFSKGNAQDQVPAFSRNGSETDYTPLADALKQLSQRPELFKFPKLQGKTLEALAAEIDPNIKVTRPNRSKDNPNRAQYPLEWTVDITMPDEKVALVIKNKDRIMLNAIELTSGTSRGSELYQMVGAFAYHNNLKFVGDTAGISPAGSARRLEHLISLALKYGTTRFIEPHEDQNIPWKEGDDAYNIVQLLKKSVELVSNDIPAIKDIRYDINEKRFYNIKTGNAVSDTWFQSIAKSFFPVRDESRNYDRPEPAFAGSTTLKRTALAHTVLQGDGQEVRDGILAWITQQLDSERLDPAVSALYYSKRSKKNPAQTGFFDDETPLAPIVESEEENQKRMKVGYTQVIRVNAAKLQAEFEKQNKEKLIHKPLRVEKLRGYAAWDAYPHVGITPYIDRLSIADGRHRVAVAAERGQDIEIAVPADRVEALQALLGSAEPATTNQDAAYLDAVKRGDMEAAQRMVNEAAEAAGVNLLPNDSSNVGYKTRRTPAPKKTVKVYKAFRMRDGKLYPMFVGAKDDLPIGVWMDATEGGYHFTGDNGREYIPADTGVSISIPNDSVRSELLKRGYIKSPTAKSIKVVAYRPGWHGGELPFFPQAGNKVFHKGKKLIAGISDDYTYPNVHEYDTVIAEVEMDADRNYKQEYIDTAERNADGSINKQKSGLRFIPKGGFYEYATNPLFADRPDLGKWFISGSVKINRIISQDEVNRQLDKMNVPRQAWNARKDGKFDVLDLNQLGYDPQFNHASYKLLDPVTYDDAGNVIPLSQRFNPNKQDVRYSKNQTPAKSGVSVSSITETLVTPKEALWRHAGLTVRVVKSAAGLPADVRSKITNAEDVEGFYDRSTRTAYLLSDNLDSLERAREVLRHEAVGHYATHNLRDAIEFIRVMNAIERLEKVGNRKVRDAAAQIDKTQPGLGRRERQEEIFARLVESGEHETIGLIKSLTAKLMQAVKRFMDTLFGTGFSEKLTINDVLLWAKDTQALLDKGTPSQGQWMFSLSKEQHDALLKYGQATDRELRDFSVQNVKDGINAFNTAMDTQEAVNSAMYRPELGWIDFEYGTPGKADKKYKRGFGLSHLLARRGVVEGRDIQKFSQDLIMTLALGEMEPVYGHPGDPRVNIRLNGMTASVSLRFAGAERRWLLTGFYDYEGEKSSTDVAGRDVDLLGTTRVKPYFTRPDLGAVLKTRLTQPDDLAQQVESIGTQRLKTSIGVALSRMKGASYSFAGEKAKTANLTLLQQAKQRVESGEDAEQVRKETGWFKGLENKWKFEIDDSQALLNRDAILNAGAKRHTLTLGEVLNHPTLFYSYPSLSQVTVIGSVDLNNTLSGSASAELFGGEIGGTIKVSVPVSGKYKKTLLHEVQHLIQAYEGFAKGSAPTRTDKTAEDVGKVGRELANSITGLDRADYRALVQSLRDIGSRYQPTLLSSGTVSDQAAEMVDAIIIFATEESNFPDIVEIAQRWEKAAKNSQRSMEEQRALEKKAFKDYQSSAGEIESRDTENRLSLTPEQRQATPPYRDTMFKDGIADEDVIVKMDGGGAQMRVEEQTEAERQMVEVRAQYEGTDQWMKAPNGEPTKLNERQWLQVRTPLFKEWFGDFENDPANASKVVDKNGEPLIVYHGTKERFIEKYENYSKLNQQLKDTKKEAIDIYSYLSNDNSYEYGSYFFDDYSKLKRNITDAVKIATSPYAGIVNEEQAMQKAIEEVKSRYKDNPSLLERALNGSSVQSRQQSILRDANDISEKLKQNTIAQSVRDNNLSEKDVLSLIEKMDKLIEQNKDIKTKISRISGNVSSKETFNTYPSEQDQANDPGYLGKAAYFTPNKKEADGYARLGKGYVYNAFLNIRNPLYMDNSPSGFWTDVNTASSRLVADGSDPFQAKSEATTQIARKYGFDGVYKEADGDRYTVTEWAAYNPNQIKSAIDNTGEFSSSNPDIRYSRKSSPSAPPFDEVGQDVTDMTKSTRNVFERLADKGRDYFKLGTALLTRQQLVELASRPIPGLKRVLLPSAEYFERAASLIDGIKSRIKREMYDGLVPQWLYEAGKNRKLAYDLDFILHGSTMHQVDPTKAEGPKREDYNEYVDKTTGVKMGDEEFAIAQKWYETLRKRYLELQKVNPVLADVIGRVFENYTKINDMKYAAMKERVGRSGFGMARVMLDTARANDGTSKKAEIAGERTKAWLSGSEKDREAAEKVYQMARDIEEHGVEEDTDNQNSAGRVLVPVVPKIHKPIVDGDSERVVEAKKAYLALSAPQKTLYHERRKLHNIPLSQRLASLRGHDDQAFEALAQLISTTQRRAINILVDRVSEKSMVPEEHAAMQAELAKLPEEAQFLYRDIFSHFRERQRNLMKSIELYEEASRGVNPYAPLSRYGQYTVYAEKVVEKKDSQGQPVLDEEGNPEMETLLGYQKFEAIHDQRQAIAQLESKGWTVSTNFKTIQDKIEKAPNGTFVTKMYNFIDESVSDALERNVLKQSVYDLYLESLPDLSVRKHLITRKGIPGFNRDALRAYGQFMNGSSNMIARLRYADVLQEQLFQMENEVKSLSGHIEDQAKAGMLLDEMKKSYEWQMNPQNAAWANKLTSLGFIWHLTNPSTAIINLSQLPLMTFPELATKFGSGRSFSAIGKAMRDYMKVMEVRRKMGMNIIRPPMAFKATRDVLDANGQSRKEVKYLTYKDDAEYRNAIASLEGQGYTIDRSVNAGEAAIMETLGGEFNGDMGRFMEFLEKSGRVSRSATTQLAGLGEDNWQMDQGSLGTLSKIGSMTMQVGSFLFHHSEVANREITALASYRLMREELKSLPNQEEAHQKAQEYAYKTVAFTQGDYSNANRARWMRNNFARVAFLFKTYGQMMTFRMMRDAYQSIKSGTPEDKRQARVRLGYMVMNASLLGGAMGLPIYTAMIGAWSLMEALTGDDDDPFDPELWLNQQLAAHLGDQGRKLVMSGPMGSAAMLLGADDGVSLSSRLSLDIWRMWIRKIPGDKEGAALADEWIRQVVGPVVGLVPKMLTGVRDLKAGSAQLNDDLWWRGWESIMPSPLANAVKAYRYGTEGVKTRRGDDLMEDVTTGQIISQAMGFQPSKIGDLYAENTMLFERKAYLEKRSRNMISGLIRALEEGDTEAATEIREGIRRFNERNPLIRITSERIKNARRQKQKIRKDSDRGMFIPSKGMRRAIEQERFIQGE